MSGSDVWLLVLLTNTEVRGGSVWSAVWCSMQYGVGVRRIG